MLYVLTSVVEREHTWIRRKRKTSISAEGECSLSEFYEAAIKRFCKREEDRYFHDDDLFSSLTLGEWCDQVDLAACMLESLLQQGKSLYEAEEISRKELSSGTFSAGMTLKAIAVLASLAGVDITQDTSRVTNGEME